MPVLFTLLLLLLLGPGAVAQPQPSARPPVQPQAAPAITPEQARQVLEVLNDPARRAAFTATLEAIVRAQGAVAPPAALPTPAAAAPSAPADSPPAPTAEPATPKPAETVPLPLAPDSLGAQVLVSASAFVNHLGVQVRETMLAVRSLPLLWGWLETMVTSPSSQAFLLDAAWRVLLALLITIGIARLIRHLLRGPIARLEAAGWPQAPDGEGGSDDGADDTASGLEVMARAEAGESEPPPRHKRGSAVLASLRRAPRLLARLGLAILPMIGVAIAGHLLAGSALGGQSSSRLIMLAVIDSYAICSALLAISRVLMEPGASRFALAGLEPEKARSGIRRLRWLTIGGIGGYVFGEVGFLLGMSPIAHAALQKAIGLYAIIFLIMLVIEQRRTVRRWLRAPDEETGPVALLRNQLARIWHWIACMLLATTWLVWALERGGGAMLSLVVLTVASLPASRIAQLVLHGLLDKLLNAGADGGERHVILRRLRSYERPLHAALSFLVNVVTLLILLDIWGLPGLNWLFTAPLGLRILSATGTMLVTVVIAFGLWELVNAAIEAHLDHLDREAKTARSARLRTLLPLLRTALIVTIAVIAGLMVLSEIGVNIAPLLAGAGIVGIAIGFGSQRLVQDLITGIFLLLENTMQVGDVVKVGELVGTVESLSVRTIRLRSEDGSVHVIPFSAVTTVTNMTREFSRAVLSVVVAADENYDRVVGILREIVEEMRAEPAWSGIILDELEVFGLQELDNIAMTIRCRIRCTAFGRWSVGREFNRRRKLAFEQEGIRPPSAPMPIRG